MSKQQAITEGYTIKTNLNEKSNLAQSIAKSQLLAQDLSAYADTSLTEKDLQKVKITVTIETIND